MEQEELGNTIELRHGDDSYENLQPFYLQVEDAIELLLAKYDQYHGEIKVTIEFHPDEEQHE